MEKKRQFGGGDVRQPKTMDYVYCGNEAGGRADDIITLTSIFFDFRILMHFGKLN